MPTEDSRDSLSPLEQIQELARNEGVSVVGVAPVERFEGAPRGHHPTDFIPKARSVVVFGIGLLPAAVNWQALLSDSEIYADENIKKIVGQQYLYFNTAYEIPNDLLECAALRAAMRLQQGGFRSLYFPVTFGLKFRGVSDALPDLFAPFSHRHAAVRAGLAEFGLNNLVVTPQFGPRCRFTSIITEAELPPSPLLQGKVCLGESCSLCLEACPAQAISVMGGIDEDQVFLNPVSRTDKKLCQKSTRENFCAGVCINSCPLGKDGW